MWAKFGQKVGSMFMGKTPKNKMTIAKFKAKKNLNKIKSGFKKASKKAISLTDKYPKTTFATGLGGAGALYGNTEGARVRQNQIIEMQKISKERKTRKISKQEINQRLARAKQSKREFTWI